MKRWSSLGFRSKLTLTAIGVITVLYLLLGLTVRIAAQQAILTSVDNTLRTMAAGFEHERHRPPPPLRANDHGQGPDGNHDHHNDRQFDGPPGQPDGPNWHGPPPGDRNDDTVQAVNIKETRPQLVWRENKDIRLPFPLTLPTDVDATMEARHGGPNQLETVSYQGEPVRVITVPFRNPHDHHVEGVIQINYWLGDIDKTLASLTATLFLILPVGIFLMGVASRFVVGKTVGPIRDMTAAAGKIGAEDLSGRLEVIGEDEFSELASTINEMFARLEVSFTAQKEALGQLQEVLLQQRRFTADASHELKTPLAVVKVNASLLKSVFVKDPDGIESVDAIDQAVNRMSKLVQDLLLLARTDSGQLAEQFGEVDLISTADQAASLVPCARRIDLSAPSEALVVRGSQFAIERLLTNLLDNACRHSEMDTRVRLEISKSGSSAIIKVIDHGEGVPAEHLPKIFERFHRVDGSRHSGTGGAGLGLAIGKGIVEAHGGMISVESELGNGTVFTVVLPCLETGSLPVAQERTESPIRL